MQLGLMKRQMITQTCQRTISIETIASGDFYHEKVCINLV